MWCFDLKIIANNNKKKLDVEHIQYCWGELLYLSEYSFFCLPKHE